MTNAQVTDTEAASKARWCWLDGPPSFSEPDSSLDDLAAALASQTHVPLSYGDWACVLQREDSPAAPSDADGSQIARRYELSFWVHNGPAKPGERLGPPGVFVESLEVHSGERQSAEGAMREAITALLGQAAEALDAWPARSTSPQLKPPKASARLACTRAKGRPRRHAVRYVLAAVVAIVAAILVQGFVVRPYVVPSVSMAATASPREAVFVDRIVYRFRSVHRGDLVVLDDPRPPHEMLMTRVVGLPGDSLSLRGGYLFVDGAQTSEALTGRVADLALPTELNAGETAGTHWTVTHPYRLPAGEYFVASDDPARYPGTLGGGIVPRRAIVGQAFLSFWPLGRVSRL